MSYEMLKLSIPEKGGYLGQGICLPIPRDFGGRKGIKCLIVL